MNNLKAAWLIPSLLEGSGGHRTIINHINNLSNTGVQCVIYVEDSEHKSSKALAKQLQNYFGECLAEVKSGWDVDQYFDVGFATVWYSAKVIYDTDKVNRKYYFVQDFEPSFNPIGDEYLMAESSYTYGLKIITIGRWLAQMLHDRYQAETQYFDFSADLNVYKDINIRRTKTVCFVYQPEKPRRCTQIGLGALRIVKHYRSDIQIELYGSNALSKHLSFQHKNRGLLTLDECNYLYNESSIGLCISASNPSRIPFEMMAAGLPVVDIHKDNNLFDQPDDSVILAESNPEAIALAILDLLDDESLHDNMSISGKRFMKGRDKIVEEQDFVACFTNFENGAYVQPVISKSYNKEAFSKIKSDSKYQNWPEINAVEKNLSGNKNKWRNLLKIILPDFIVKLLKRYRSLINAE